MVDLFLLQRRNTLCEYAIAVRRRLPTHGQDVLQIAMEFVNNTSCFHNPSLSNVCCMLWTQIDVKLLVDMLNYVVSVVMRCFEGSGMVFGS